MNEKLLNNMLDKLSKSKFRSSFHLNKKMKEYVNSKDYDVIRRHAYDFIDKRLKKYDCNKDGKQTPMRQVHPVFIAQHACACCCRECLKKWHNIDTYKVLSDKEIDYIVDLIMLWIKKEMYDVDEKD